MYYLVVAICFDFSSFFFLSIYYYYHYCFKWTLANLGARSALRRSNVTADQMAVATVNAFNLTALRMMAPPQNTKEPEVRVRLARFEHIAPVKIVACPRQNAMAIARSARDAPTSMQTVSMMEVLHRGGLAI